MTGVLAGVHVVEFAGIGPAPFAGMLLADHGAEIIRIDRTDETGGPRRFGGTHRVLDRGRRSIALNLKADGATEIALELLARADVLIEAFRPGTMERLGLGPDVVHARNPRLVYARMTGWGQNGPRAQTAGHDIDYIAITGALEPINDGKMGAPVAPLNMLGDFGGGGMLLAFGVVSALLHARNTGHGQVIDAAIVDGTSLFTAMLHSQRASGEWTGGRGHNLFDGGAPYYGVFETADRQWLAVGAIEPQFYREFVLRLGLTAELPLETQENRDTWPTARTAVATRIASRTRAEWENIFEGSDACVAPVLAPDEAPNEGHMAARAVYASDDGMIYPNPAPRFSGTPGTAASAQSVVGQDTKAILRSLGFSPERIALLIASGTVASCEDQPRVEDH